jgi:hypothetical protein
MKTTIEQIHGEFDTAQELILEEAKRIISENKVENVDYIQKMKQLGFVNSDVVKKAEKKQKTVVENNEMAELVMYYKREYPFLKFLTEDKLDEICDKYNLIYAPVNRYKKSVPEKNLNEIQSAKRINHMDRVETYYKVTDIKDASYSRIPTSIKKKVCEGVHHEKPDWMYLGRKYGRSGDFMSATITTERIEKDGLFIAAPKSHFNLNGLKSHKKGFFKSITERQIPDPIVFRYVRGGIQVLSKWGDESNDISLQNEILN